MAARIHNPKPFEIKELKMPKNTKSAHLMTSDGRKIALNRKVESGLLAILEIEAASHLLGLAILTRKVVERITAKAGA